ncbi:L-rhamnose mutarotase [Clostridium felsineum]|uniref:L-rhamnose mutarotase n=1 Tax=Clostridium felsineum TaxID=36839 RepID=UPI00098C2B3B|nr:L-rhamnose mutarotase [Clostridium felsineum]URZ01084.1 L-rhamnose mutarotase [Clostridium felsineum]
MIRKGTVMKLFNGFEKEYELRHSKIWPEMVQMLHKYGAKNYSIFLDKESNNLFAYVEIENEERWNKTGETEICKKWWEYMKDIMETNKDNSPVTIELREVFHLD